MCFGSWAVPSLLQAFFFPSFWYRFFSISAVQRMFFQKWSDFFRCFWKSLIWPCVQLVVNPLYLLWWSLLLIVDFDSDTSTPWTVFFSWLDVVKGVFFTTERILRSSTTVVLCGHPGLLCCCAHQCIFLRMFQTVDLATPNFPAISLVDLICFWILTIVCFTCLRAPLTAWCRFTASASKFKWR